MCAISIRSQCSAANMWSLLTRARRSRRSAKRYNTMKTTGQIIISPRITEKGAYLSSHGAYLFNVAKDASKRDIATAIHTLYKVVPRKVTLVSVPRKRVSTRVGRRGQTRVGHSAGGK